jgi:hypothetical protein
MRFGIGHSSEILWVQISRRFFVISDIATNIMVVAILVAILVVLLLATDPEVRVRFREVVGLELHPISLASTIEELLEEKVAAPV